MQIPFWHFLKIARARPKEGESLFTRMKALALLSGGLDSTLAIKVVLDQGIEIEAVNCFTPFCQCSGKKGCGHEAKRATDGLGVRLKIFNISTEYIEVIKAPRHGYGKNINPCIDCRILMLRKAKEYMKETGSSFIITGEVLGQRPMSQHKAALRIIERESGLEGLILRPLSAKLFPPSIPEKEGWINRKRLLEISGRSRKPQMALAAEYGIADYPCPAGGCLLTDPGFTRRMKDLLKHCEITLNDIQLLKLGRHFRLRSQAKLIVGRNKEENETLLGLAKRDDICFRPVDVVGPIGIGRGNFDQNTITLASQIMARYSDGISDDNVSPVKGLDPEGVKIAIEDLASRKKDLIIVKGISDSQLEVFRI
jgi:tRNA U34 2-thiouridine synthase MnmA/TrmU